jgi:hypothetical protein
MSASILLSTSTIASEDAGKSIVDIHFHADARPEGGGDLPKVDQWMRTHHVDQLIVMQYRQTLPRDEQEAQQIVKNFEAYRGRIYRFCVLLPDEVPSKAAAVKALGRMQDEAPSVSVNIMASRASLTTRHACSCMRPVPR